MLLTKQYQLIGNASLTYGELRTYAKYNSQSAESNATTYQVKSVYYCNIVGGSVHFNNGSNNLDGSVKNYGDTRFYYGETVLQELTRTLTHNPDGSSPTKAITNIWTASFGGSNTVTSSITVPKINRLSTITVNNGVYFNVDTNENVSNVVPVVITKYNTSYTQKLKISVENIDKNVTLIRNYTDFNSNELSFSETELQAIYNSTPTWKLITFIFDLQTITSTGAVLGTTTKRQVAMLSETDLKPTFENFTYSDNNPVTFTLTGDRSTVVKGYSKVRMSVAGINKAIAHKGASIVKYTFMNGSQSKDYILGEYPAYADLENVDNREMSVWAIDSRNESTKVEKIATNFIDYKDIEKISFTAERKNGNTSSEVTLKLSGNIWNGNFGTKENSIKCAIYKYKKTSSTEWIDGTTELSVVKNGTSYSLEQDIKGDLDALGFEQNGSYDIYIEIQDELSSISDTFVLGAGSPALALKENCVSIGAPYDDNLGGRVQILGAKMDDVVFGFNIETNGPPVKTGFKEDGKDVYVKKLDCGILGAASQMKDIATGITGDFTVLYLTGKGYTTAGNVLTIPYNAVDIYYIGVNYQKELNKVRFQFGSDRSNLHVYLYIFLKYND